MLEVRTRAFGVHLQRQGFPRCGADRQHQPAITRRNLVGARQVQTFLSIEIIFDRRQIDAGLVSDLPDRRGLEALVTERLQCNNRALTLLRQ